MDPANCELLHYATLDVRKHIVSSGITQPWMETTHFKFKLEW